MNQIDTLLEKDLQHSQFKINNVNQKLLNLNKTCLQDALAWTRIKENILSTTYFYN